MLFLGLVFGLSRIGRSEEPPRLYGVLQTTVEHARDCYGVGLRVAVVPVNWDRFEPKQGEINATYVAELLKEKQALRKLGYKLQIDFGIQYAPEWVFELPYGRYQNQFSQRFVTKEPGGDVPNVVFSGEVRCCMESYVKTVFARLGSDWDYVRLGCARCGELNYPQPRFGTHENCYWAFDDLAQGKAAGLPPGLPACPVPGWIPGLPSPEHKSARRFVEWYLDCLRNYQGWQIATVRRWYAGDICMLYGSWGQRPGGLNAAINGDLAGLTSEERNGEIQQGYDWARMIGAINDPQVIVYCTWMDGTLQNQDICDDNNGNPERWSPVHWQASLARSNPLHLRVWGENTGRNNRTAMQLTFERIKRFDLMGVMWAFDRELFADPNPEGYATFADYAGFIGTSRSAK